MLILESIDIILCTYYTTTFSTTLQLSALQDKKTAPEYGYACEDVPSQWEWISNWFFIGQQPYQAKDHWRKIKLQQRLFNVMAISQRLFHTSIYRSEDLEIW
jgi:hypothetical protein